ncbi:MAG TPA: hypothetical protein VGM73_00900 [Candidatus Didemnitutus sp.]
MAVVRKRWDGDSAWAGAQIAWIDIYSVQLRIYSAKLNPAAVGPVLAPAAAAASGSPTESACDRDDSGWK